jgi:hypothetical protein
MQLEIDAHLSELRSSGNRSDANRCPPVFYGCKNCAARLKPKRGNRCVFCSYGSVPCRPDGQLLFLT